MMKQKYIGILLSMVMTGYSFCFQCQAQQANAFTPATLNDYLARTPFKMKAPVVPVFAADTFNIKAFGAVPDGLSLNTTAFDAAMQKAAAHKGGATVLVPPGLWLTGPIRLRSHVNLHLARGAVLLFTADHTNYPMIKKDGGYEVMSPLYGDALENIAITGEGIIDGSGDEWRPIQNGKVTKEQWDKAVASGGGVEDVRYKWKDSYFWWPNAKAVDQEPIYLKLNAAKNGTEKEYEALREYMRPDLLKLVRCKNVLLDGPTFKNSPLFNLYLHYCTDMTIRNIAVQNEWNAINSDGIDLLNCKNTIIYRCTVNTGDDGICMKSSGDKLIPGEFVMENILIADCTVYHAHGGFVIGSGIGGGMRNIYVSNCSFIDSDVGIRLKSKRGRGGLARDIYVDGVYMDNILKQAILISGSYAPVLALIDTVRQKAVTDRTPRFENIHISNVACGSAKTGILIEGLGEMPVKDVFISNASIRADNSISISDATNIHLTDVKVVAPQKVLCTLTNVNGIHFRNLGFGAATKSLLQLKGNAVANITVANTKLDALQQPFIYDNETTQQAISVK